MSEILDKVKELLIKEIQEKMKVLPFGFGQEEGCEGFPKWTFYIDSNNELFGKASLTTSFDKNKTILENLHELPINQLTILAEHGLSGEDLFKTMQENHMLGNGMGGKAWDDANQWKSNNKLKI